MDLKEVKGFMNKIVYYDTGQLNLEGHSIKEFIFSACILRKKKEGAHYYQAELTDTNGKSMLIVPLESVLTKSDL